MYADFCPYRHSLATTATSLLPWAKIMWRQISPFLCKLYNSATPAKNIEPLQLFIFYVNSSKYVVFFLTMQKFLKNAMLQ